MPPKLAPARKSPAKQAAKSAARSAPRPKLAKQPSHIAMMFRHLRPNFRAYIDYARVAAKQNDRAMQTLVATYDALSPRERKDTSPEALCELADIDPRALVSAVSATLYEMSKQEVDLITAINYPLVIDRVAREARTKKGYSDRENFLKATGYLPQPKSGPAVVVNNRPQTTFAQQIAGSSAPMPVLLSAEDETRRLEDAIDIPMLESGPA